MEEIGLTSPIPTPPPTAVRKKVATVDKLFPFFALLHSKFTTQKQRASNPSMNGLGKYNISKVKAGFVPFFRNKFPGLFQHSD